MTILYAVNDEDADERIEKLIAAHSAPKNLTVVSSDHRIRQAATRRRHACSRRICSSWTSSRGSATHARPPDQPTEFKKDAEPTLSAGESAYWLNEFRDLENMPETREMMGNEMGLPSDDEIAEIEREIEREFREGE